MGDGQPGPRGPPGPPGPPGPGSRSVSSLSCFEVMMSESLSAERVPIPLVSFRLLWTWRDPVSLIWSRCG